MLMPQVNQSRPAETTLFLRSFQKPFIHGTTEKSATLPAHLTRTSAKVGSNQSSNVRIRRSVTPKASLIGNIVNKLTSNVNVVVTVLPTLGGVLTDVGIGKGIDDAKDLLGQSLQLELVSAELDPKTGLEKKRVKGYAHKTSLLDIGEATYEVDFDIPKDFGEVGAIIVQNEHHKEMFLKDIKLDGDGLLNGSVTISCNSWVHSKYDNSQNRIFFTNKSYLPSNTPSGLKKLREQDLKNVRGNGKGERKSFERIYDYDVYNDLGSPDLSEKLKRPVLGGKEHPYPRRCRTGRPPTWKDPSSESRNTLMFYVPRDENFSEVKTVTFGAKTLYSVLHALIPALESVIVDENFPYFTTIDTLFDEGIKIPPDEETKGLLRSAIPRLVKAASDVDDILQFEPPEPMDRDKFFWLRDEEFGRQTLAGLNPHTIQLVTEWPLKSKLDPSIYGPAESAITKEIIEQEIRGFMTLDEAIKEKKLFMLDYHDLLLPYVSKVRQLEGTTLYGSRTIFFLTNEGTLRPLAIELTRPPMDGKPQWKQVFTPTWNATGVWLWRLAKAHVLAHDSGVHQLVSHWLRTHCVTEPYIIATKRQLSAMHPIFRLLNPHFRYTMEINALARQLLINANGIIESTFSPGKYSIEISSVAYDKLWRFDHEALPADLISRGLAVEDPNSPHGLKLTIEDYPFANDGLLIWDAIKQWVTNYVNYYYSSASQIQSDEELQAWWTEIRTVGHADKKDEPWWPVLETPEDLIQIVTTIVWVTSGHHAAVNFGQYTYGGYFPNRATIARTNVPTEDPTDEEWKYFLEKPEGTLLQCLPTKLQAAKVMTVLDVLSSHSPEEEYLGEKLEAPWGVDPYIKASFEQFNGRLKEIEGIIDERNANSDLRNRHGAGIAPYELLKPFSEAGVTGKGVPYSISI
ncbi:Lipoxygenase [Trema orientale]|uniref:Lipoxygenase n=1 Tax=Trema orientale TaxID=63057 RepID=A0A2P5BS96_TREOI|nr:Lipoxygenase [Trema orientale]